jgi:hypothetical protein
MFKKYLKHINLLILTVILPSIYGCSGGGIGELTGLLFGSGAIGILSAGGSSGLGIGGAGGLATVHTPEPASMLLLGSSMMAMAYFKSRKSRMTKQ